VKMMIRRAVSCASWLIVTFAFCVSQLVTTPAVTPAPWYVPVPPAWNQMNRDDGPFAFSVPSFVTVLPRCR
jgi:hypothetical protein